MTERLDLQRPPSKWHARRNSRWYKRGYEDLPHRVWGDETPAAPPPGPSGPNPAGPTLTGTPDTVPNGGGMITFDVSDWTYPDGNTYTGYVNGVEEMNGDIDRATPQVVGFFHDAGTYEVYFVLHGPAGATTATTAETITVSP